MDSNFILSNSIKLDCSGFLIPRVAVSINEILEWQNLALEIMLSLRIRDVSIASFDSIIFASCAYLFHACIEYFFLHDLISKTKKVIQINYRQRTTFERASRNEALILIAQPSLS